MGKLSVTAVKAATRPGRIGDGDGLFLVVKPLGTKSWMVYVLIGQGEIETIKLGSSTLVLTASLKQLVERTRTPACDHTAAADR